MNIVNVGYDSTNYYVLETNNGTLLVDCGWPGTLPKFLALLKRKDVSPNEIKYLLVTHFHPDHSGLTQELKNLGASLILMESQVNYINAMDELYASKKLPCLPITQEKNILLKFADSREFLAGLGLEGEILPTPGHSDDSVTLILDQGFAFTGDLPPALWLQRRMRLPGRAGSGFTSTRSRGFFRGMAVERLERYVSISKVLKRKKENHGDTETRRLFLNWGLRAVVLP